MLGFVSRINRLIDRLARGMSRCAGWLFVLCAFFVTFDVLARRFFGFSSQSTTELSGYMLGVGIAWGLAGALEARTHVRIDILIQKVPPRWRGYLHWVALATLAVFAGFLAYGAWHTTLESWDFKATDNSLLKTPLVIPQGLWLLGIGVFGVMAVLRVLEVALLLPRGGIREIELLTGPRSYVEEADEALQATGHLRK
ncbi:MAG: TRAP transporter small permease [Candidatus Parcubacteria bacterium]|nr:TRAP transporter small permease [Burkholderiales bacterium]